MRYAAIALATLSAILLYLLALATGNTSKLAEYYWWVFGLNALLFAALAGVVARQILKLRQRVKSRVFGAKLAQRLVVMFAVVALVPGALVFTVSAQFLTRSIESWFNVSVEAALDRGLDLGRNALGYVLEDVGRKSRVVLDDIDATSDVLLPSRLERLREQLGLSEIAVFTRSGQLVGFAGVALDRLPMPPGRDAVRTLRPRQPVQSIENGPDQHLYLKVLLAYRTASNEARILQVQQAAPETIARDAELIEQARADYRQLLLARSGLTTFYTLTLALACLLALTAALAFGLFLSERLSAPLAELAAGTRAVAQGDYSRRHPVYRRDELGILTTMFNRMTQQLDDARHLAEENRSQLEAGKLYLESILTNLSAGVMAFDSDWKLRAANTSAARILAVDFSELAPSVMPAWATRVPALSPLIDLILSESRKPGSHDWQKQLGFEAPQGERALLVRGSSLPESYGSGHVVVFDDITELARAQRDAAWGEVAKRLAHEIRNPLTPIQLSAERLAMKLSDKLEPADADMLRRSTDTIVKQVTALKGMVDAFREYARAPRTQLNPLELNALLREVMTLYEAQPAIRVSLSETPLEIMGDAALLRQVVHNLLQNAQDAVLDAGIPIIQISSRKEGRSAVICVEDNGPGFGADILPRAFEPYVTSKTKGTGLGLAVVKKIVDEHHGQVTLVNAEPHGARILLTLPLLEA
ncbi:MULTISPECIES: sensor histidine kinase [Gulbenkiania]|uniref:histidine kinase n=2 Tax=Gulbenkiania TaxID=397456 RepID=A0A0K6GYB0_9NEIS|nr:MULTISPECIES: ATP-binding protein [Gulbenkiania]TCW32764.1 nitrogen fixation/metabolism regulation signal transduction histidine kinase [Gulbenkiania mobilis]CUA83721.1 Signal transduction histidine kinase involved in nitrogen fixation and metabolism regulation [Gulbenkiania indica]